MTGKVIRIVFITAICVTISTSANANAESPPSREYLIKAAFLYNFAKFVEWPTEAFPNDSTPITLCILGEDPFGDALESIKGKTIRGRDMVIRHVVRVEDLEHCHILFVSASEEKRLPQILNTIRDKTILTVSDMNRFARRGGIINLVTVRSKIRFEINVDATDLVGLRISSKLLRLARIVKDGRGEENN
ncbi:MAG: YfiR family protein [Desulfobacterales bacterium]|nr:YfiR family protein [Desulfobacterales bacterium]